MTQTIKQPYITRPHTRYRASFIAAMREALAEGQRPPWHLERLRDAFDEYVQVLLDKEQRPLAGYVPETVYWLDVKGVYGGQISVRHHLTPALERYGGHIGYDVRPSMRRRGYGTLMCAQAIQEARRMGLGALLITCDDDNFGSQKIIEANGGRLQDKIDNGRHALTRRYWID